MCVHSYGYGHVHDNDLHRCVKDENLRPSCCDHPLCGFHGDFIVLKNGTLHPLSVASRTQAGTCGAEELAEKNREFVGRRWQRPATKKTCCCCEPSLSETADDDIGDMDNFLRRSRTHGFTITSMAFQDAGNLDLERLRSCSLHVFEDGALRPFCAHYIHRV